MRVQLLLGWRGVAYERVPYGYADVEGPRRVHPKGEKALPVLELVDGGGRAINESMDIIKYLEAAGGALLAPQTNRHDLSAWKKRFKNVLRPLARPRVLRLPIPDFASEADVAYARAKYEGQGFNYEGALAQTAARVRDADALLLELDAMLCSAHALHCWGLSMDDLLLLPDLRTLTAVAGVAWPEKLAAYVRGGAELAGIELYSDHAC